MTIPGRSSGRPTVRSTPLRKWQMAISYRVLLWELIPGRPSGRYTTPTPVQASSGQERYYCRSASQVISLWIRLLFYQMYPPSKGISWPRDVLHHVSLTFDQHVGKAELLVVNSLQLIWAQTYLPPPYRHTLWTFHIFVLVNTTHMVVNSDTIVYMCMEVIICQSDRSLDRLTISHAPSIGGTSNHLRWEKEYGGNFPSFWDEFCKTLPTQNRIFLNFQNCGILDLPHFCICQLDKYSCKKLYSTVHVCGNYDLSIWEFPWRVDDISHP